MSVDSSIHKFAPPKSKIPKMKEEKIDRRKKLKALGKKDFFVYLSLNRKCGPLTI
jgi:hypothetical protein